MFIGEQHLEQKEGRKRLQRNADFDCAVEGCAPQPILAQRTTVWSAKVGFWIQVPGGTFATARLLCVCALLLGT